MNARSRSRILLIAAALLAALFAGAAGTRAAEPPSFVVLLADDLGYGDLGCYGHPTIRTPSLDRMAAEGMRFTQFYCAAPVCTPSRAALLTGRLPIRSGMCGGRGVLFPDSTGGLPAEEVTIAEALKARGYRTACIGKWHLGHLPPYLPTRHGFDSYFGLPYSNDMDSPERGEPPVPLIRDEVAVEQPVDLDSLSRRYTAEAVRFIRSSAGRPFFLYLAYTFPHVPLAASPRFRGRSPRGLYGDVVEELDASVGEVLEALRASGRERSTLVVFTSDNGPWLSMKGDGGSAGLLRDGKGTTWEGGMRVPGIFRWPGRVPEGVTSRAVASTLDLFPTFLALAGVDLPRDRTFDGADIGPLLSGPAAGSEGPLRPFFYYEGMRLMAVRKGPWKAHLITQSWIEPGPAREHAPPLLFQLDQDPSETEDVGKSHPQVIEDLLGEVARHRAGVRPVETRLQARVAHL